MANNETPEPGLILDRPSPQRIAELTEDLSLPTDPTTSALVGAEILRLRSGNKVSLEAMAHEQRRTEVWFGAAERGEIAFNGVSLIDLEMAFEARDIQLDAIGLVETLQTEPIGDRAQNLRKSAGVPAWIQEDSPAPELLAGSFAAEALSPRDRLLVVVPLGVLASVVLLTSKTLVWSSAEQVAADAELTGLTGLLQNALSLVDEAFLPAAVLGLLVSSLMVAWVDRFFSASQSRRGSTRQYHYGQAQKLLTAAGLAQIDRTWAVQHQLPFVIGRHRGGLARASRRLTLYERMIPISITSAFVTLVGGCLALWDEGAKLADLVFVPLAVLVTVSATLVVSRANLLSGAFLAELTRGLGLKLGYELPELKLRSEFHPSPSEAKRSDV